MLANPINLPKWINENSHLLRPPINNYCVYDGDVTVMIVGGPNARSDYHINSTPEWFYQHRGSMLLRIVEIDSSSSIQGTKSSETNSSSSPPLTSHRDIPIHEGDMFLLPPNTPHNPIRFANTVGLVIEQRRPANSPDTLRWYCQSCGNVVNEASFQCSDLGVQIKEAVEAFAADIEARTCGNCKAVCELVPQGVVQP